VQRRGGPNNYALGMAARCRVSADDSGHEDGHGIGGDSSCSGEHPQRPNSGGGRDSESRFHEFFFSLRNLSLWRQLLGWPVGVLKIGFWVLCLMSGPQRVVCAHVDCNRTV